MTKKTLLISLSVALAILIVVLGCVIYGVGRRVRGQYFDSAGVSIYYTDEGAGVPVILVHGYAANSDLTRIFHKISVAPANLTPYQALCLSADFDVY